ncbi:hypothetical protein K1X76_07765 [bacterium]|nr:hypothetical protein [bacterium]
MTSKNILQIPLGHLVNFQKLEKSSDDLDLSYSIKTKETAALATLIHNEIRSYFNKNKKITARSFLGKEAVKTILNAIEHNVVLDKKSERWVKSIIHSDYIKNLFGETIHVAIVSFYKKVNPLFGGLATSMLEKQIRGAIDFVINMVLDVAVGFVLNPKNQKMFAQFVEGLANEILDVPMHSILESLSDDNLRHIIELSLSLSNDTVLQNNTQKLIKHLLPKLAKALKAKKGADFIELNNESLLDLLHNAA